MNPAKARQLDVMLGQTLFTGFYSIALTLVCALLMRNTDQFLTMLIWVSTNGVFVLSRWWFIFRKFALEGDRTERIYARYEKLLYASWFTSGVIWGIGGYLFLPDGSSPELFVSFIVIFVGVTTANIPNYSSSALSGILFVYPTLLGLAVRVYEYAYSDFLFITFIYLIFITMVILRLTKMIGKSIILDVQNAALLTQVTDEKENAERLSQDKTRFLAAASHDLRQPLNSLGLFLYSLRQTFTPRDEPKLEYLNGAENAHEALSGLFSSLLEIARFDDGSIKAHRRPCKLQDIISPIAQEYEPLAQNKDLQLLCEIDNTVVDTDPVLLNRIVRNLIDNAIKYTKDGTVKIHSTRDGEHLKLSISDTGVGIASAEQSNIFDEYHQINNKKRDRRQGIGLGLSIVKKISQLLQHPIKLSSTPGIGSNFTITLPMLAGLPDGHTKPERILEPLYGIQALIVDDESDVLKSTSAVLQSWGCEAMCAENIEQAVKLCTSHDFDLVISDFRLHEDINGLELLEHLFNHLQHKIPAIIISGNNSIELQKIMGSVDYGLLIKPVKPEELHRAILLALE